MAKRNALLLLLCGGSVLLLAAPPAEGRARSRRKVVKVSPEEAAKRLQRTLFKEAQQHFVAGRYAEAAEAFKKAFEARPHRSIQVNIALAYVRVGDNLQAHAHLQTYMKMRQPSDPPLPEVLQQLPLKIGRITVRVPDPKAGIFVDGQRRGHTEVTLFFEPSKRVVDIRLDDRIVATRIIDVSGGQEHVWEISQDALDRARPRPRPVEVTPTPPPRVAVVPPTSPNGDQDEKKSRLGRLHWGYFTAVAVLTAAVAGAAAYTSFKNLQIHDDFVKDPSNRDLQQEGILYQNTANGLWGATAAAATTAILLAIFTRWRTKPKERAATVWVTPFTGPGSLGLSLTVQAE